MAQKRKSTTAKKAAKSWLKSNTGLLGGAARGLMGRKKRLESMIQGKAPTRKKGKYT